MTTEKDFPFDASADVTRLHGLNKLRAVADRGTAAYLHDLHVKLEPTWRRQAQAEDFGAGGLAVFPDDYSDLDTERLPEQGTAARTAWDRKNALVFAAWEEFIRGLEAHVADHYDRTGRELTRDQLAAHRERFAAIVRRQYGIAYADKRWIDEHAAWQERRG